MMSSFLPGLKKYYHWWINTLLSCLPEKWLSYFNSVNRQVDFIILHRDDRLVIQNANNQLIDSISINYSSDQLSTHVDEELDLTIQMDSDEQIDQTEVIRHLFKNQPAASADAETIQHASDDTTILFNREDSTTRLQDLVDEDTVIIDDDQGTLLSFNPQQTPPKEDTVVYYNDRGTMRPLDNQSQRSADTDTDIDFVLNEPGLSSQGSDNVFNLAASLAEKYCGRKKCLYLLPDDSVFSFTLNYPIEVLENIETVLRFDLEKHIPLSFHEVRYFYALNINKPEDKVNVDIVVMKTTEYNDLQSAFADNPGHSMISTTADFYKNYGGRVNFLESKQQNDKSLFTAGNLQIAVNLLLLCGLFILPYYLYSRELDTIEVKSEQEIKKVSSIVSTINNLNSEVLLGEKLSEEIKNTPRMIYLLERLSENIDRDAWITRFSYKNGDLKIKGEAKSATSVSDSLNDTGLFESIKFTSSIVKNPKTRKESFELSLKVKSDA